MSANLTETYVSPWYPHHTVYCFEMPIPIPSYLLAIVAGHIVRRQIDHRTYVVSEPTYIDSYVTELSDLGLFLNTLEDYVLDYRWGIY